MTMMVMMTLISIGCIITVKTVVSLMALYMKLSYNMACFEFSLVGSL